MEVVGLYLECSGHVSGSVLSDYSWQFFGDQNKLDAKHFTIVLSLQPPCPNFLSYGDIKKFKDNLKYFLSFSKWTSPSCITIFHNAVRLFFFLVMMKIEETH